MNEDMGKSLARRFVANLKGLRADERGAESSEMILVLVVLVIGLLAAFAFLRDKLKSQTSHVSNCIGGADTVTTC